MRDGRAGMPEPQGDDSQICSLPSEVIRCKKRRDYVHLPRAAVDLKPGQHRPRQPATPPYYT